MPPKTPTKCSECAHVDDLMDLKREMRSGLEAVNTRINLVERDQGSMEGSMKELNDNLTTVNRAILGDMERPDQPGMAENVRSLRKDVSDLVKIHHDEIAETTANPKKDPTFLEKISWKIITLVIGAISILGTVAYKLIDVIQSLLDKQ